MINCSSQVKHIGLASTMYSNDNDDWIIPPTQNMRGNFSVNASVQAWQTLLANQDAMKSYASYQCPSSQGGSLSRIDYAFNYGMCKKGANGDVAGQNKKLAQVVNPSWKFWYLDCIQNSYVGTSVDAGSFRLIPIYGGGWTLHQNSAYGRPAYRHKMRCPSVMADGHMEVIQMIPSIAVASNYGWWRHPAFDYANKRMLAFDL